MASVKDKIQLSFSQTKDKFKKLLNKAFSSIDISNVQEMEELLLQMDISVHTASYIVKKLQNENLSKQSTETDFKNALFRIMNEMLNDKCHDIFYDESTKIDVIILCGINGNGKTTTAAKLAYKFQNQYNKSVVLAACDTFRAAATEQLSCWSRQLECDLITTTSINADPASVAYKAIAAAIDSKAQALIIDTAGRLHTQNQLMDQLQKIKRVVEKKSDHINIQIIMVADATIGQNIHSQIEKFNSIVGIDGIIITKLDSSARGGMILNIAHKFDIKICEIGVGEGIEDLHKFDSHSFLKNILDL